MEVTRCAAGDAAVVEAEAEVNRRAWTAAVNSSGEPARGEQQWRLKHATREASGELKRDDRDGRAGRIGGDDFSNLAMQGRFGGAGQGRGKSGGHSSGSAMAETMQGRGCGGEYGDEAGPERRSIGRPRPGRTAAAKKRRARR